MAYVFYIPPAQLLPSPERPSLCNPSWTASSVCGPALIFLGGTGALMVGFFERNPVIIWPIISLGVVLCIIGVFMAQRHVKQWREQEQERQRAMWRSHWPQPGETRRSGGDGAAYPLFDVPMYCLEAPIHSVARPSSDLTPCGSSQYDIGGDKRYDSEYWCVLAVPLRPDNVTSGEYLDWTAMALVVQPHSRYGKQEAHYPGGGGGATAAAAGACHGETSAGILTRAWSPAVRIHISQAGDGAEGVTPEHLSEPVQSAFPLSMRRSTSLGARSAHGSLHGVGGGGGGSERRVGRGSRPSRIADLLSLFTAGNGGSAVGGDDPAGGPASGTPDADANGVELAGVKAMAAQVAVATTAVAATAGGTAGALRTAAPPSPPRDAAAAGPSECSTPEPQGRGSPWRNGGGAGGSGALQKDFCLP